MINTKIGAVLTRVVPPTVGETTGYCQSGTVYKITDDLITVRVQVDLLRLMEFNRNDGSDTTGLGSFLVTPDWID